MNNWETQNAGDGTYTWVFIVAQGRGVAEITKNNNNKYFFLKKSKTVNRKL